ncbi:MAG: T9SS type A sorting domain-containing protein [Flavobacteriales bacterium]|jgi:hypothetical protein
MKFIYSFVLLAAVLLSSVANAQVFPGSTCDTAIELEMCVDSQDGNTVGILNDSQTSGATACSGVGTAGQLWYSYTAYENVTVTLSTCGSNMDTKIHVYGGSCGQGNLYCLVQNDDFCAMQSQVSFPVVAGETYLIRVGGFGSASGAFTLNVTCGDGEAGCTDYYATNYDPAAVTDDGSCVYSGCMDSTAANYNPYATIDDGSCFYYVYGCTNPAAVNYNQAANADDGTCVIEGCTDQTAINYDWSATIDNGSCEYCNGAGSATASLYICTFSNGNQVELQIVDDSGNEVYYASGLNNAAIVYASLCLQPGVCYTANMINNSGPYGWYNGYFWVNVNGVQIINAHPDANAQFASVQFSIDGTCGSVFGCTDPTALNYNAEATMSDGSCQYPTVGCTDSTAVNFDPLAAVDDGSCIILTDCAGTILECVLYPGTFANEASYIVTDAAGNTITGSTQGVASAYACVTDGCYTIQMFDTFGDGWDGGGYMDVFANGSFIGSFTLGSNMSSGVAYFGVNAEGCTPTILGCTDPFALNYNPMANEDDGSCEYPENCVQNLMSITISTQNWGSEIGWSLVGADGVVYAEGGNYSSWGWYTDYVCVPDGCYEVVMNDSWGDGWNGAYYAISSNTMYTEGSLYYGASGSDLIGVNSDCGMVAGCMDSAAYNYNPQATYDDGSCLYNVGGGLGFDNGLEVEFALYPNPTNGGIIVNATSLDAQRNLTLNVYGAEGRLVRSVNYQVTATNMQVQMDLSDLQAGYYMVQLTNGTTQLVKSLIKQ